MNLFTYGAQGASVLALVALLLTIPAPAQAEDAGACTRAAQLLRLACAYDAKDDSFETSATCDNLDTDDMASCEDEVADEREETEEECNDVFEARLDLCDALGDEPYEPEFGEEFAENFVDPLLIGNGVEPNPYMPLIPGNQWVYESEDETVTVTVTDKVKLIEGVTCIVVNDIVEEDDVVLEDTDDWMAQDVDGNVWYCGEIAQEYEFFEGDDPEEAELVEIEGSWKAGRDDALPGILMPAEPEVGAVYRQEVSFGEAEDAFEILSTTGTESVTAAQCTETCLITRDFSPLEPEVEENKYYVAGIGLILEIDLEEDVRLELVEFSGQ